jgi:transposase
MQQYGIKKLLNIPNYSVTKLELEDKGLTIWLEPYKRNKAKCGKCGKHHKKGCHSFDWVRVKDLEISGKAVYLLVLKRKYMCPDDRRIYTEEIDWLKHCGRVTKRYAVHVSRLTAITTNTEAGWFLGLDDQAVYRIDKEILEEQAANKLNPPPAAKNMSVDEVSYRKYHNYLTNVIDVDIRKVVWNAKGRTKDVMDKYYKAIGKENCEAIDSIAMDGARSYISSAQEYAVNALIVCDKFHIVAKVNRAVDDTRKHELKKARKQDNHELVDLINCKQRFILLKKRNNLSEKQEDYLHRLCNINQPIYEALLLKESFLQLYSCRTEHEARIYLTGWLNEAFKSKLEYFHEIANSLLNKFEYILNWFKKKISSAISEGFNNKIKRLKRMGYGYRDVDYFLLKIHQHCGLLNPRLTTL